MILRLTLALSLISSFACGDDDGTDSDAGMTDSATSDSGGGDDAGDDAGGDDAGTDDAGTDDAGTDDAGSDDAGSEDVVTSFCEAAIARDEMCGDTPSTLEECVAEMACTLNVIFRTDAASAVVGCIGELDCDASDDPCFTATGLGLEPSEGADAYTTACTMRREECGGSFSDDFCFVDLAASGVYDSLTACLDDECDTVGDCLLDVVTCAE